MTSSSREDCSFQMFSPTTPHFFKIILAETLQENKLRIPPKFARKHMETLTGWAILKLPIGSKWQVEVKKCDSEVWLEKGWSTFAQHNSLKSGDFLVFRYEMDSQFHVFIFGRSAIEIDYAYQPFTKSKKQSKAVEENRTFKEQRKTEFIRKKTLTTIEKERALERTNDFKSKNPYFKVVMQPTYVKRCNARLELPKLFAERYLDGGSSDVILKLLDGKTWFSKMVLIETYQRRRYRLHHGWNNFVCDKNLQVGDVCVFVLKSTDIDHFMFEVLIFHANDNLNSTASSGGFKSLRSEGKNFERKPIKRAAISIVKASKALKNASKYIPKNPFFKVTTGSSYMKHGTMPIPAAFFRDYIEKKEQMIKLELEERSWPVNLSLYNYTGRFGLGWCAFVKENSLRVGDVCIFEQIKRSKIVVLRVSIFRG